MIFNGGINNFGVDSEATIQGTIQTYCEDRKTANAGQIIYECNFADANSYTTKANNINTWLSANYSSFADHIIDVHSVLPDHTDLTLFEADGLHNTTLGYTAKAGVAQTALGL